MSHHVCWNSSPIEHLHLRGHVQHDESSSTYAKYGLFPYSPRWQHETSCLWPKSQQEWRCKAKPSQNKKVESNFPRKQGSTNGLTGHNSKKASEAMSPLEEESRTMCPRRAWVLERGGPERPKWALSSGRGNTGSRQRNSPGMSLIPTTLGRWQSHERSQRWGWENRIWKKRMVLLWHSRWIQSPSTLQNKRHGLWTILTVGWPSLFAPSLLSDSSEALWMTRTSHQNVCGQIAWHWKYSRGFQKGCCRRNEATPRDTQRFELHDQDQAIAKPPSVCKLAACYASRCEPKKHLHGSACQVKKSQSTRSGRIWSVSYSTATKNCSNAAT